MGHRVDRNRLELVRKHPTHRDLRGDDLSPSVDDRYRLLGGCVVVLPAPRTNRIADSDQLPGSWKSSRAFAISGPTGCGHRLARLRYCRGVRGARTLGEVRPIMSEHELDDGWDLARPTASALPGVSLAGFCDRTSAGSDMRIFARPEVIAVVQFGESALVRDSGRPAHDGLVTGMSPGTHRVRADRVECVEVRLSPIAAYRLLGVAPTELNGTVTGLDDLWGSAAGLLREQLAETSRWDDRFAVTTQFLAARESTRAVDPEVGACWDRIIADRGGARVRDLAELTGWSRKRLWHRFTAQLGVTPKHATMVVRFRRVFDLLLAGQSAADVAAVCGYADQSHLHREVSAFAGTTPGAISRR